MLNERRPLAAALDLGHLAVEVGAVHRELLMAVNKDCLEALSNDMACQPGTKPFGNFEYDFGPYVLDARGENDAPLYPLLIRYGHRSLLLLGSVSQTSIRSPCATQHHSQSGTASNTNILRKQRANDPDVLSLCALPPELLLQIALLLEDRHDALSLRLTRELAKVGLEAFARKTPSIYIENSQASLARFEEICSHPLLAAHIKEVIYVAAVAYMDGREDFDPRDIDICFGRYAKRFTGDKDNVWIARSAYVRRINEQRELFETGRLQEVLACGMAKLPRLEKFSVQGTPLVTMPRWYLHNRLIDMEQAQRPAHNGSRIWHNYADSSAVSDLTHVHPRWLAHNAMLSVFLHHWRYYDCGSIMPFLQAISTTNAAKPGQGVHLSLEHWSIGPFDEELGRIAAQPESGISTVFQNLTSLKLNMQLTVFTNEQTCGPDHYQPATPKNLARQMCRAQALRELELTGNDKFTAQLMRILSRDATWPLLQKFTLDMRSGNVSERYDLAGSFGGVGRPVPDLLAFLLRHSSTIEHLYLRRALRDDHEPAVSTTLLRPALQHLRQGMFRLQSATVIEDLENLILVKTGFTDEPAEDEVPDFDLLLTQKPHEEVLNRHRAAVKASELGQMGEELGAIYSESSEAATKEYILEFHNDMGLGPEVAQRGVFSFDFGPYVLGGREVQKSGEEQSGVSSMSTHTSYAPSVHTAA